MDRWKSRGGKSQRREEKRRREKRRREKMQVRQTLEKSRETLFFFRGSGGSASRVPKAAGAEPSG